MNDLSFEAQGPYTPPPGDAADFTFQIFVDFSFEGLPAANPPIDGILNFSFGGAISEDESESSSATEIFVQYGQAESTVFEDPIIEIESSSASLLSVFSGFATSTIVEAVSQSSAAVGISRSFGVANNFYIISQTVSSSSATLHSILSFESCSSRIDVDYTKGTDTRYGNVSQVGVVKGVVLPPSTPLKGTVLLDDSYKKSKFKVDYTPYGNVYEPYTGGWYGPGGPGSGGANEYKFYYLNTVWLPPLTEDVISTRSDLVNVELREGLVISLNDDMAGTQCDIASVVLTTPVQYEYNNDLAATSIAISDIVMTGPAEYPSQLPDTVDTSVTIESIVLSNGIPYGNYNEDTAQTSSSLIEVILL